MEDITDSLNTGWAEMYMESRRYTWYPTNMIHKTQINITSPNLGRPRCNKTRKQILEGKDNPSITLPSDNIRKV